jgi:hypothetical protein
MKSCVAEYLHDNEEIIGSQLSGMRVGDVPGYGIYLDGPQRAVIDAAGGNPVFSRCA